MEDILEISSRSGFNARSWALIKPCRCEGEETGAPLGTTGLLVRDHTRDLVGRNCYLVCHVHHHRTRSEAGGQTGTPASTELLIPCAAPIFSSTQGHLTGRASATSRVLITRESENGAAILTLVRWGRWKEVIGRPRK